MLEALGFSAMEDLIQAVVPSDIRSKRALILPVAATETEASNELAGIANQNFVSTCFIGEGYYPVNLPAVIQRGVLENPAWYTQYTPYQPEISQGRLESLLNFQTMIQNLTALPVSNASLLDEGTAAAEAVAMAFSVREEKAARTLLVHEQVYQHTLACIKGRAYPLNINVVSFTSLPKNISELQCFAVLWQNPFANGSIRDLTAECSAAKAAACTTICIAETLSLSVLKPPGKMGFEISVGSTQRFGVPMGFGGPHAAYLACVDKFKRLIPGRLIGVSKDVAGRLAYRLSLQTREQHIRRERATSNICTAQALLANIATFYGLYHGSDGLRRIGQEILIKTDVVGELLRELGWTLLNRTYFDTISVLGNSTQLVDVELRAKKLGVQLNFFHRDQIRFSINESTSVMDLIQLLHSFGCSLGADQLGDRLRTMISDRTLSDIKKLLPENMLRSDPPLQHPVFSLHNTETKLMRYIKRLESKDLSLVHSMIPLGSCTMKLNAAAELLPISWPTFASIHPFAPMESTLGYRKLISQLESWLAEITGFDATSLQPNAGSQGEFAGLLAIRRYQAASGQSHRNTVLIPRSAHGTNPASAVMAGLNVMVVDCDSNGNIDLVDLRKKIFNIGNQLSALMITYPSTHGVFEESIREVCELIHEAGGQVYMDGANMNAQVGLTSPGVIGADVCHLNLHKTFCIPHGGGGPGVGPICVRKHLAPFLPGHPTAVVKNLPDQDPVAWAPFGSAGILPIAWMYIRMMGPDGLMSATQVAILNANYIAKKLEPYYPVLYKGEAGMVAHECIIDLRPIKAVSGIDVDDVAKRLMDYGFHAPTMSFPVPGTLMIEPTESESKDELDRFCSAMISIRDEISAIEAGLISVSESPLRHAPHPIEDIVANEWMRQYTREQAAFPVPGLRTNKFWPSVSRIDGAFGDRNLVCSCPGVEQYAQS